MFGSYINKTENRTFTLQNPSIKSLVAKQVTIEGKYYILPRRKFLSCLQKKKYICIFIHD